MFRFHLNLVSLMLTLSLVIACTKSNSSGKLESVIYTKIPKFFAITIGDTIEKVESNVANTNSKKLSLEGVYTTVLHVKTGDDVDADIYFDEKHKVYSISTKSSAVKDEYGLGVGSTLEELKHHYPLNYFGIGNENGPAVIFVTPGYLIFEFEPNAFPDECFTPQLNCEFDDTVATVSELRIVNIDMSDYVMSLN